MAFANSLGFMHAGQGRPQGFAGGCPCASGGQLGRDLGGGLAGMQSMMMSMMAAMMAMLTSGMMSQLLSGQGALASGQNPGFGSGGAPSLGNAAQGFLGRSPSGGSAGSTAPGAGGAGQTGPAGAPTGQLVDRPGGKLDSSIVANFDAMVAAAKKDGVNLQINSAHRSRAEQERLYAAYLNGTGNLAAKPGTSNHEKGQAIDFKNTPGAYDWLAKNAEKYGFKNLPGEPWHYSPTGR